MFVLGEIYRRRDLHEMFGGQQQCRISTPSRQDFIMLFTGESGKEYANQDGWCKEGCYLYTGEGQRGDMLFERGNLAILEHASNGKDIHLFEKTGKGRVRYVGEMVCTGFRELQGLDTDGNDRRVIVFELTPIAAFDKIVGSGDEDARMWQEPLNTLRELAITSYISQRSPSERRALARYRSEVLRVYVLRRAHGVCEACGRDSPFRTDSGRPYLELHHVRRLSNGGPDHPQWVIGLCPTCHRQAHHSMDKAEFNQRLERIVNNRERRVGKEQRTGRERRAGTERRTGTERRSGRERRR